LLRQPDKQLAPYTDAIEGPFMLIPAP